MLTTKVTEGNVSLNVVLFFIAMIAVGPVHATTLEFDLTGVFYRNHREVKIDVKEVNKVLAEKGLDGLPEKIVVSQKAEPYGKLLLKRIEAANRVMENELLFVIDHGYLYEFPTMCYRGEASDVPGIIDAMAGTFLNDEQGILAFRYRDETVLRNDAFKSKASLNARYEGGNRATRAWLNFDVASSKVLVMHDLGPQGDGTELYANSIVPCR